MRIVGVEKRSGERLELRCGCGGEVDEAAVGEIQGAGRS